MRVPGSVLFLYLMSSFELVYSSTTIYGNSSVSIPAENASPTSSVGYAYCSCIIDGNVDAFLYYGEVLPVNGSTVIYTVIEGTHSTIGSQTISAEFEPTLAPDVEDYLRSYLGPGVMLYTDTAYATLAASITEVQQIFYEDMHVAEFDTWSTMTIDGTITSMCAPDARSYPFTFGSIGEYIYNYTTSYAWGPDEDADFAAQGGAKGQSALFSYMASIIGAETCSGSFDGIAGLKVGVTVLTATSVVYQSAPTDATTLDPGSGISAPASPVNTPTPTLPPPTPTPESTAEIKGGASVLEPSTTVVSGAEVKTGASVLESTTASMAVLKSGASVLVGNDDQDSTIGAGSPPTSIGGSPPIPNAGSTPQIAPIITTAQIGNSIKTIVILPSSAGYVIDSQTISSGGTAIVVGGITVSDDGKGIQAYLYTGTQTSTPDTTSYILSSPLPWTTPPPPSPSTGDPNSGIANAILTQLGIQPTVTTPQVVIGGSQTYTISYLPGGGGIEVDGQTLTQGGDVVLGTQTVSLVLGGTAVVVGGSTTEGIAGTATGTLAAQYTGGAAKRRVIGLRWEISWVVMMGVMVWLW